MYVRRTAMRTRCNTSSKGSCEQSLSGKLLKLGGLVAYAFTMKMDARGSDCDPIRGGVCLPSATKKGSRRAKEMDGTL
eukprot:1139422-Pelagomonas_calceolata.AAC.2